MAFTKYTNTEGQAKVLSPEAHKRVEKMLHKQGKTSADELTEREREEFIAAVHSAE